MASSFDKEIVRSITGTLGRFVAIAAIVALGCGFYAGLRMTAPDMDASADRYYDGTALMDVRVVSTLGLTDDDVEALRQVEGVDAVMPARETDVMATIDGEQYAVRVHSLPDAAESSAQENNATIASDDANYLNRLTLVEGSWPTSAGECVISYDRVMNVPTKVGDVVTVTEGVTDLDDTLVTRTYTIVGYVRSPYYVCSTAMGTTSLGSGTVQQFMYVPNDSFVDSMPYTEAFCTVEGAADLKDGSAEYDELIGEVIGRIEVIAPEREQARLDGLRAEAQAELDNARADFEAERADATSQLDDAANELARAREQLDAAQQQLAVSALQIEQTERQLAQGRLLYEQGVSQLASQEVAAKRQLAEAEDQLGQAQTSYDAAMAQRASLQGALDQVNAAIAAIDKQMADMHMSSVDEALDQALEALATTQGMLEEAQAALAAVDPDDPGYAALKARVETLQIEVDKLTLAVADLQALQVQRAALVEQAAQLEQSIAAIDERTAGVPEQLAAARAKLYAQRNQVNVQLAAAQAQLAASKVQLDSGTSQLEDGKQRYEQGRSDYESGRADYESGRADYENALAEAESKFADAEAELASAQRAIDDLEAPTWLVMDRSKNYGAVSFASDAERVDHIARVFPFIFFLVAALVSLTTMTRMVEEERVLIGTYKALGYSRARITSKYVIYAAIAAIVGAVVGIVVLSLVLPAVIMEAYAIIYSVPKAPPCVDLPIALLSAGLGVGVTLGATWAAVTATLREQPAHLMLPRAPKAGKRILLERVTPLWRRVSFSWKVTFRNLFRYKKRLFMTVIGIAGCTALLLTGLGLQNSINDIIDKQYGELVSYNAVVVFDEQPDDAVRSETEDLAQKSAWAQELSYIAQGPNRSDIMVSLAVPQDPEAFQELWTMRERAGHEPVNLGSDGVVVTEKLANELGLKPGDELRLAEQDQMGNATSQVYEATITGIMENYVDNWVFMGPEVYKRTFGVAPEYTSCFAHIDDSDEAHETFGSQASALPGVRTVSFNDEVIDSYKTMLRSVNMVVVVLVVAAAALAFIVLYNLTNINITERVREIATLKVLGFMSGEVNAYIFREITILSIVGAAVGLVLGVFLEGFVIVTAEVDQVMFGRDIHATSFVLAFALTMVFTVIVMTFMRRKLAKVSMVESLKSNE
ncbi:FtsX-like permease family protein [Adlercreutzia sp. ZJ141]|uniref:FtsX-like permease family protein n=1 Tax=Adlercreutzia sp. ZJ141 TaxID=2709406 RepID=UPI0013EBF4B7|nr:FtsX-like permease family protein [Adlercreutzia sp. ZJ141]